MQRIARYCPPIVAGQQVAPGRISISIIISMEQRIIGPSVFLL